jgi:hypothetical protein
VVSAGKKEEAFTQLMLANNARIVKKVFIDDMFNCVIA